MIYVINFFGVTVRRTNISAKTTRMPIESTYGELFGMLRNGRCYYNIIMIQLRSTNTTTTQYSPRSPLTDAFVEPIICQQ